MILGARIFHTHQVADLRLQARREIPTPEIQKQLLEHFNSSSSLAFNLREWSFKQPRAVYLSEDFLALRNDFLSFLIFADWGNCVEKVPSMKWSKTKQLLRYVILRRKNICCDNKTKKTLTNLRNQKSDDQVHGCQTISTADSYSLFKARLWCFL